MIAPTSLAARWGRALLVGAWVGVGAGLSHSAAGGPPPLMATAPVIAATVGIVVWCGRRRLTLPATWALLALSQIGVHLLSAYLHQHSAAPSASMVLSHLVGLTVVSLVLAVAEQLWWSWWRQVTAVVQLAPRIRLPRPCLPLPVPILDPPAFGVLRYSLVRRGPPTLLNP